MFIFFSKVKKMLLQIIILFITVKTIEQKFSNVLPIKPFPTGVNPEEWPYKKGMITDTK